MQARATAEAMQRGKRSLVLSGVLSGEVSDEDLSGMHRPFLARDRVREASSGILGLDATIDYAECLRDVCRAGCSA
jgi:hypothetical protein